VGLDNWIALLRSHIRSVMPRVAHNFQFFADYLVNDLHQPVFETRGHRNQVSWDPSGVALLITPQNAPADAGHLEGGTCACCRPHGGPEAGRVEPKELRGLYYQPTLFAGASTGSEILTQEVFGPVLTVQTFRDEVQAVQLANGTEFGLAAVLYTGDPQRAERVAAQLVAGTTGINCFFVRDLRAPFGGSRHSGVGREGGTWSFDFYCDVKNTCTNQQRWAQ